MDIRILDNRTGRWRMSPVADEVILGGKKVIEDYLDSLFREYGYSGGRFNMDKDKRYDKFNIYCDGKLVGELMPHYYDDDDIMNIDYPSNIIDV